MTSNEKVSTCSIALACLFVLRAEGQILVFSTTTDQPASPVPVLEEELHLFDGTARTPCLTREMLGMLVGDADGNSIFDDHPLDIDAAQASGLPEPGGFFLSVTADFTMAGGTQIKDGDVFHFTTAGAVVDLAEAFFETATGTSAVDVDGFATSPAGDFYFSFAEDETTTDAGLTAQNGGSAVLDEQCVFKIAPGGTVATIHLTPAAVTAAFNAAFGTTATTVVDVDGIESDPANPGELLLTSLSASTAFRGKVITTAGGGAPFMVGGQAIGPAALGLPTNTSLDALTIVGAPFPVLRSFPAIVPVSTPILAKVESGGWAPGTPVQFVVTDAVLPRPAFVSYPAQGGYNASPLDVTNPTFFLSFTIAAWLVPADATGAAALAFSTAGIPAGINAVIQTVDLASGVVSTPASMAFIP